MNWKRGLIESVVRGAGCFGARAAKQPEHPSAVFVLRNNDIGDLLIITPLFEALKRLFPRAQIIAGIGGWNQEVLRNNPWVDQVVQINAPWHNKQICKHPHNSPRGFVKSLHYIFTSNEVRHIKNLHCDIAIDVLGSPEGSLMMIRAGIPWRLGVKGYAGGYSGCQQNVAFDEETQVGRASLRFAELLGATSLPESRPQLFLTEQEKAQALKTWSALSQQNATKFKRILIAPGGGFLEKCWPREDYQRLVAQFAFQPDIQIAIIGSRSDYELGEFIKGASTPVANLCGKTSLRETFALVWASEGVICNGSMILHAAAAFDKPTIVLLGKMFDSAQKHKQLWGYGANDLHLGLESGRNTMFTVEEAIPIINSHFGLMTAGHTKYKP
jgi:ADP-heptose:LPS heptosyltransferase